MTKFAKIENGIVVQIQSKDADGFIAVPDNIVCGMVQDGGDFINPPIDESVFRRAEILAALNDIDRRTIRPLRAGEADKLAVLEAEAAALRQELGEMK